MLLDLISYEDYIFQAPVAYSETLFISIFQRKETSGKYARQVQNAVSAYQLIKDRLLLFSDAKILQYYEHYVRKRLYSSSMNEMRR